MKIKICDLCKKEIKEGNDRYKVKVKKIYVIPACGGSEGDVTAKRKLDLCQHCMEKIVLASIRCNEISLGLELPKEGIK